MRNLSMSAAETTNLDRTAAGRSGRPATRVPSVVVVDPAFESYKPLATSAREGKLMLHLRSAGREALKLARRHRVDAWLIAPDLDDMSGFDFVEMLRSQIESHGKNGTDEAGSYSPKCIAMVGDRAGDPTQWASLEAGADHVVTKPITFEDLERILGMSPEERQVAMPTERFSRTFIALPIGVGAAVVAIAIVMLG